MGIYEAGIPRELTLDLRRIFGIERLVETGTLLGDSALWASEVFSRVTTIEASEELYNKAVVRLGTNKNISVLLGDSRKRLREVISDIKIRTIFWLDAHWSEGNTSGEKHECPLLRELEIILNPPKGHVVLIDDARLFLSPPPRPHDRQQWPTIREVCRVFNERKYEVFVYRDVIIGIPIRYRRVVAELIQEKVSRDPGRPLEAGTEDSKADGRRTIPYVMELCKMLVRKSLIECKSRIVHITKLSKK